MPYRNSSFVSDAQRTSGRCNDDGIGQNELAIKDVKPRTERNFALSFLSGSDYGIPSRLRRRIPASEGMGYVSILQSADLGRNKSGTADSFVS